MPRTYNKGRSAAMALLPKSGLPSWGSYKDIGPDALRTVGILKPLCLQRQSTTNTTTESAAKPPTAPAQQICLASQLSLLEEVAGK